MSRAERIRNQLATFLSPAHLEVLDESHMHSRGKETHFRVLVVSDKFVGLTRIQRARLVQDALKSLFQEGLHALTQAQLTPEEWQAGQKGIDSPLCSSKNK